MASRLMQIFPSLTVVSIQASSTFGGTTSKAGHGIAIGGCTVPMVLASAISAYEYYNGGDYSGKEYETAEDTQGNHRA